MAGQQCRSAIVVVFSIVSYTLCLGSSDTEIFFLPLALRADNILRPLADAILVRNPCLFFLFLFDGWNVLFIARLFKIQTAKVMIFSNLPNINAGRDTECKPVSWFQRTPRRRAHSAGGRWHSCSR
jgi:hypothetical protein